MKKQEKIKKAYGEYWETIIGFQYYQVNKLGIVKSIMRTTKQKNGKSYSVKGSFNKVRHIKNTYI